MIKVTFAFIDNGTVRELVKTYEDGKFWDIKDGHLNMFESRNKLIATFSPGSWHSVVRS